MIVVMAKVPVPGRVKTRMIPLLGAEGAAALARAMAADVIATVRSYGCPFRLALEGDLDDPWVRGLGVPVEAQCAGDLGARLRHALRDGGIAVGMDAPTLPFGALLTARNALRVRRVVLMPAFDGGYVLVGVTQTALGVFDDIPWSAPDTYAATLTRARELGFDPYTLPFWYDVDEPRDLVFLRNHLRTLDPDVAPHTRAFLQELPDAALDR